MLAAAVVTGAETRVLDDRTGAAEPGEVTGLGEDRRGADWVSPAIEVTSSVSPSSLTTATMRVSVSASRRVVCCQSARTRPARSSAPARCEMTPCGSASAANTARTIRRFGRIPCQRGSSRRTAVVNRSGPKRRSRRGSPAQRSSTTASEAHHVLDRNGLPAAASTAGQIHLSRSRSCCTAAVDSVVSAARRAPRCPSRAIGAVGFVATPLGRQPRDQHRVFRVGLVPRQVLGLASPPDQQRLRTHQPQSPFRGKLIKHPPPVTSWLVRHRHRREPRSVRPLKGPVQQRPQLHARHLTRRRATTRES
jgi:hypothetical protein